MSVHRIEVRPISPTNDPKAASTLTELRHLGLNFGITEVRTTRVYFLQGPDDILNPENLKRITIEILSESPGTAVAGAILEVHLKPGVMDMPGETTEAAIRKMFNLAEGVVQVRTATQYTFLGQVSEEQLRLIAKRLMVNESIEIPYFQPFTPAEFATGHPYTFKLVHVLMRDLTDEQLMDLSKKGHLFLDLREMQAIQNYFREQGREPTDVELEALAQTWSEHCVHKTLKATVEYTELPPQSPPSATA
ncbi:MAG: phosphoribosylformylglycinamidine synthase subunit PurS, partial [Phycisphaerales bacterium]|nr:phosphoribosylformylglycinamidine synthase subunit PurS [Phycisphaerales bacterium]